jgi:hypothetical protein
LHFDQASWFARDDLQDVPAVPLRCFDYRPARRRLDRKPAAILDGYDHAGPFQYILDATDMASQNA